MRGLILSAESSLLSAGSGETYVPPAGSGDAVNFSTFTSESLTGSDTANGPWSNPGNTEAEDSSDATYTIVGITKYSDYLQCVGLANQIPAGSTIDGIEVFINRSGHDSASTKDYVVSLVKGGTVQGDNKADTVTSWPASVDSTASYGGAAVLWGLILTAADVNAADFGVVISTYCGGVVSIASIDHVYIKVYFS